ncbi:MAG TPA: tubulin-like doman-containing protein [Sedimentisphaerales bacterium]|jgi:hypothetical protein|nr:tubulin-like doman-containing protein [Sedimentisphaerales bacterium]HNU28367.1 tubulin-like doman-containing protein [Sedimentisphaerales bacterium]
MRLSNSPIVVRPTLIVGLGGTGGLVCQWAEHYIRELFGHVPSFIRFLKLDTDASDDGGPPEGILSDFINLFHYVDVGEVVRDNVSFPEFHPHLDWMRGFREDATFADYGCQGIPRLGRLVFFELRETIIHEAVATRFSSLRTSTQQLVEEQPDQFILAADGAPAVHIASSVCGGTGAGMLIDMAYNLRWWSRESFPKPAEVIGHLLLPDAFRVDPMLRPKLEATASATLDQIEFLSDERRPDIPVRYRSNRAGEDCFRRDTAPFNFLYLLNGQVDMGSGDRKHLVRQIARVIRAMAFEPLGQQVRSDANNKLAEILPQRDPVNNHRQCFSSYGLWCGTPGHRRANIESRILSELETLGQDRQQARTDYRQQVQKRIATTLGASPGTNEFIRPSVPFAWDPPGRGTSQEVVSNVLQSVRRYIEISVLPAARKEGERVQDPNKPIAGLLEAADEMFGRDFFNAEQLKPISQIGACLDAWTEGVETLLDHKQAVAKPTVNAVVTEILAGIRQGLASLEQRVPPLSWTSSDIAPLVGEVIDAQWASCAEALLHENSVGAIKATLRLFSIRKQAMEALIELAWQRRTSGERSNGGRSNGTPRLADFFTTPLCASLDASNALDSVSARDLRQSLIKPVLFGTVLSVREVRPELADVRAVEDRLSQNLGQLAGEMKRFLRDIENHGWEVFRNGLGEHQATNEHPYYRSVCEIWRLAEPKIDLSKSRKYAAPLDVTVTQQVPSSCVPQLLTHNCEMSLREANVDENFRHVTGEWLQILRLRYGFCLEAISRYAKYAAATDEYVRRMGFEFSDLWLDKSWYVSYQHALAEWHSQAGPQKDNTERRTYEANAARTGSLRRLIESVSGRLRQQMRSVTDSEVGIRMAELHGGTSSRIDLMLHSMPLADSDAVRQGLARCLAMLDTLIQNVDECSVGLPEKERHAMTDVIEACRSDIQTFREGLSN